MILPQEIIAKKSDGLTLSEIDIGLFVDGLISKNFNDAQVGAMAMAIFQQGLNKQETVHLTNAMMKSGKVLSWRNVKNAEGLLLNGPILDKHSTGGVGDKVSFMLAAIVAACGGYVPMISGRGLGHTGGTADKLESISGFNVQPKLEQFRRIVADVGMAIISQTPELAPADRRLYAIRDVTATVASIPLITASILSKKLAAGLDVLVMDIKVGNGALMSNLNQARALAQSITSVANDAGVNTQAIITDMNQVLGSSAGNALEIDEAVKYLTGEFCEARLHEVVVSLAKAMLINSKLATDEESAYVQINRALASGKAAEIFAKMVSALGGPNDLLENPWRSMNKAEYIVDVLAPSDGYISTMQTRDIGLSVVGLGGGRTSNDQVIDHSVGFDCILSIGTYVNKGDLLARVHASSKKSADLASKQYIMALEFLDEPGAKSKIIHSF
jgi:thymidine phosphorylase